MASLFIVFERLYSNVILNLFNPKKSLLNKCLDLIVKKKLEIRGLPSDLIELIGIYKCSLRIKTNIRTKILRSSYRGSFKYKYHGDFLVCRIMELIGLQIEELIESLRVPIFDTALQHGNPVRPIALDELEITNPKRIDELHKRINIFLSQSSVYNNFRATLYAGSFIWICYRFD